MNSITITGNVTQQAEIRYLPNGDAVASFSVADNMVGKDKGAIFWRCSFFGPRGQAVSQYLAKGTAVTVIGSLSEREFTDKDGQQRKSMDVRVNDVALQGGRNEARQDAPAPGPAPAARQAPRPASGFDDEEDPDFPF